MDTALLVLKYFGLLLAAGSSIWASTQELAHTVPGESKKLTKAGMIAIGLTLAGLGGSIVSEDLQRRRARRAQAAETRRTNEIIIASQPLTSLSLRWVISSEDVELRELMEDGQKQIEDNAKDTQGGVPPVWYDQMEYQAAVLPLLAFVAGQRSVLGSGKADQGQAKGDASIVTLISLDDSHNAVLSFGGIYGEPRWYGAKSKVVLSAGFAPVTSGTRPGRSSPHVEIVPAVGSDSVSRYTIDWDLDPVTLANAIDRGNPSIQTTANPPRILKIALVYEFLELPFDQNNFAAQRTANLWDDWSGHESKQSGAKPLNIELTLVVNGFVDIKFEYVLKRAYARTLITESSTREDEFDAGCTVLEFERRSR